MFSTTVPLLREYAGRVLDYVSIEELISRAVTWLRFPSALFLWTLAIGLLTPAPWAGLATAVLVYVLAAVFTPPLAGKRSAAIVKVMDMTGVQVALYVAVLSYLGYRGELLAVGVGLAGFILLRWRILGLVLAPIVRYLRGFVSELPAPDQALRATVLHAAVRHRVPLDHVDEVRSR